MVKQTRIHTTSGRQIGVGNARHKRKIEMKKLSSSVLGHSSFEEYAQPQDQFAFAEEVFGIKLPLGVRPTLRDLDYFRWHGERFANPGTYGHVRGAKRECFRNAYRAVDADSSLTYVQGFVLGFAGLIYPHAWCVDRRNRLIETTWDCSAATGNEHYYGVRFSRHQLAGLLVHFGTFDWFEGFSSLIEIESSEQTES